MVDLTNAILAESERTQIEAATLVDEIKYIASLAVKYHAKLAERFREPLDLKGQQNVISKLRGALDDVTLSAWTNLDNMESHMRQGNSQKVKGLSIDLGWVQLIDKDGKPIPSTEDHLSYAKLPTQEGYDQLNGYRALRGLKTIQEYIAQKRKESGSMRLV